MDKLWCVTTFFNPAGFRSRLANYAVFAEGMARQGVNLLTVELAFDAGAFCLPPSGRTIRLLGKSVLWQRERLVNVALSRLPPECEYVAWLDADLLFDLDSWPYVLLDRLREFEVVQPFQRVVHLPPGHPRFRGESRGYTHGIAWQANNHANWFARRARGDLPFAATGFAWAVRRSALPADGLYDRQILGNADAFFAECCLNAFGLHHYAYKATPAMAADMNSWARRFRGVRPPLVGYVATDVFHLWHGKLENRRYRERDDILIRHGFDPRADLRLADGVYEWASDKPGLHQDILEYFRERKEDEM